MHAATVWPDLHVAEKKIVKGRLFHLRDHVLGIVAAGPSDSFEIGERGRIDAGLIGAWISAPGALGKALCPGAGIIAHVPIERFGEQQAFGDRQAHRMNVVQKDQKRDERLAGFADAEFSRLFHRIDRVAAGIGEAHHFGFRRLRL